MSKSQAINQTKPHLVSVRIPDELYKKLETKAIELETENISETIRFLLDSILGDPPVNKALQYSILSHFIMRESVIELVEDGEKIISKAEVKAKKVIEDLQNGSHTSKK